MLALKKGRYAWLVLAFGLGLIGCADDSDDDENTGSELDTTGDITTEEGGTDSSGQDTSEEDIDESTDSDAAEADTVDTSGEPDTADASDTADVTEPDGSGEEFPCGEFFILGLQGVDTTAQCKACSEEFCCEEMQACADDPDCVGWRACLAACPDEDDECAPNCGETWGTPIETSNAFLGCRISFCGAECSVNSCIGNVVWTEPESETVELEVQLRDFQTGVAVDGAAVKVCPIDDAECAEPMVETTSDAEGNVQVSVPTAPGGLGAYLAVDKDGYLPTDLWYFDAQPEVTLADGVIGFSVASETTANLITGLLGVDLDPERGHVSFRTVDCNRNAIAGISGMADTADDESTVFYIDGGLPSTELTASTTNAAGVILNVPPGPGQLIGTGPENVTWGTMPILFRAGRMVASSIAPTP